MCISALFGFDPVSREGVRHSAIVLQPHQQLTRTAAAGKVAHLLQLPAITMPYDIYDL